MICTCVHMSCVITGSAEVWLTHAGTKLGFTKGHCSLLVCYTAEEKLHSSTGTK